MCLDQAVLFHLCADSTAPAYRRAGLNEDDLDEEELPISSGRPTTLSKPSATAARPATSAAAKPAATSAALKTSTTAAKPAIKKTVVKEEEYDIDYGDVDTVNDDVF